MKKLILILSLSLIMSNPIYACIKNSDCKKCPDGEKRRCGGDFKCHCDKPKS